MSKRDIMPGNEVVRYLGARAMLYSVRDCGEVWCKSFHTNTWVRVAVKKAELDIEEWLQQKRKLPVASWRLKVKDFPSIALLRRWTNDGVCKTPTGYRVEPDGHGPDGSPSWLLALELI